MPHLTVLNNLPPRTADLALPIQRDDAARAGIERRLTDLLTGTGSQVRFSRHDRLLYSTDASLYQEEPIGVVVPATVDDALRVLDLCGRLAVAVLPRGGGTSLAGQCTNHALVLDLSPRCRAIGPVQRDPSVVARSPGTWHGHFVEVEPGCTIDELNDELARRGEKLFFAPDPATTRQATIGGCLGNNAAGARSIRYGRTSENTLAIQAALPGSPTQPAERVWFETGAATSSNRAYAITHHVAGIVRRNAPLIRERFPKTIRRNAGYGLDMILAQLDAGASVETLNLAPLLCGSEGTLALTTRARLKLMPTPALKGLLVASFASLEDAIAAVKPLLDLGLPLGLSAIELLDDVVLDAARGNIEFRKYVELLPGASAERHEPKAVLYVEFFAFEGPSQRGAAGPLSPTPQAQLDHAFAQTIDLLRNHPGLLPGGISTSTNAAAMLKAWALRKAGEPLLHGLPGARKPITFVEDNAVPVERLAEFVREFKKIVARHGTRAAYWAHASVGVLHVRPMIDLHDPADRKRMVQIAIEVADLARACGGIMSGEHGDGKVRGPLIERFFGPELVRAFREVKAAFDPRGILNPGNIVGPYGPPSSIAQGLRVDASAMPASAEVQTASTHHHAHNHQLPHDHHAPAHREATTTSPRAIQTYFDYADQHGFDHAVEMCNGAGVCRKRSGGTMCPSYMATQDERHSTRGRGNALRLAISGQFNRDASGTPDFADPDTIQTLNLCLSCKACKSECPSNVDIARLKAEYTAQRFKHDGGPTFSARIFGHVRTLNRLGSLTPTIANWANAQPIAKFLARKFLGIDERRSIPRFERSLWSHLRRRSSRSPHPRDGHSRHAATQPKPIVILYADCFTAYNEPRIGLAAVRVLEAFGYHVRVLPGEGSLFDGQWGGSGCCGRAMISSGLLADAIRTADSTLSLLRDGGAFDDPAVRAVVVCEPSCLSAIKDDWLQLKLDTPLAQRKALASRSFLVEEFLEKHWDQHPVRPAIACEDHSPVLLHAHCHQKALWGADSSAAILRRLVGNRLKVLDTGCCGMAGSFGFTADRFDLSMKIAGLALTPALNRGADDAVVCAPGTSCRHQIQDSARRNSLHPVEVLASLLSASS